MSWLNEMRAQLLIEGGWRAYATSINTRSGDLSRILRSYIDDAFGAAEGRDTIDHMRLLYRSMQQHCQMVGDLAIAMRNYHRERGTLSRPDDQLPAPPSPDDLCGASLPLLQVRWLPDPVRRRRARGAARGR